MSVEDDAPAPESAPKQMMVVPVWQLAIGAGALVAVALVVWAIVAMSGPSAGDHLIELTRNTMTTTQNARVTDEGLIAQFDKTCVLLNGRSAAIGMNGVALGSQSKEELIEAIDNFCASR